MKTNHPTGPEITRILTEAAAQRYADGSMGTIRQEPPYPATWRNTRFMQRFEEAYFSTSSPTIAVAYQQDNGTTATLEARYTDGTRQTLATMPTTAQLPDPSEYIGLTHHEATRQLIRDLMNPTDRAAA